MIPFKALLLAALAASTTLANPVPPAEDPKIDACATVRCPGTSCVVVNNRPRCLLPGEQECGPAICPRGRVCCNKSCGICTKPNQACTQQACNPCGNKVCPVGRVCCNESCGICTEPGDACILKLCKKPRLFQ
ncbi:hypothetical protein VTJ83DRAFT_6337 [Remersonia thermophila]|uniref:Uncharacterized protein n=1 Tax=Remersonia thermophila TaxID=72144 RepID=A0ABR4D4D4_9PEZI